MSSAALAFIAGLGGGYIKAKDKSIDQERQATKDKQDKELFDAKMGEINRDKADREDLKVAAAPATVQEMTGPQPEAAYAGLPAGQEPKPLGYLAGNGASARQFAEKGLADAGAIEQNKPEAQRARMASLAAQGNTLAGTALRDAVQTDSAVGQLKEQKELQTHREFARGVAGSFQKGWGGFSQFATEKFDDGNTYTPTEDGKGGAIVVSTGKDGKETGRMAFASPEEAITFAVSRADPMKWVDYKTSQGDKKVKQANEDRDFDLKKSTSESTIKIQQQQANTQEQWRKDQIRITEAHNKAIEAGKAQAGAPVQLTIKDMRDFEGDLAGYIKDQFPAAQGADAAERATLNAQATGIRSLGTTMFRSNAAVGNPLTAGTVMQAMELAKDRKNVQVVQVNGNPYEAVTVNGHPVITTGALQKKEPPAPPGASGAKPGPTAPTAATPAAAARAGVAPGAQAPKVDYSYNAQMARATADRLAKQAEQRQQEQATQAAKAEQDRTMEERRKAFIAANVKH